MCFFKQLFLFFITYTLLTNTFVEGKSSFPGHDVCKFGDQNFQTEFFLNVIKGNKLENLKEEYEQYKKQSTLYTGFVIEKQYEYQIAPLRIKNFLQVTFCKGGKAVWNHILPFQKDLDWAEPLCIPPLEDNATSQNSSMDNATSQNSSICFKFARVQKYTQRNITLYFPNKFVGFVFVCNSSNTLSPTNKDFETIPLTPIISDNIRDYKIFWSIKGTITKLVPYLHTLSIPLSRYEMLVRPDNYESGELEYKSLTSEFWKSYKNLGKFKNKEISWLNQIDPMEKYDNSKGENVPNFHEKLDYTINRIAHNIERPHDALIKAMNAHNRNSNGENLTRRKYLRRKISKMLKNRIPFKN